MVGDHDIVMDEMTNSLMNSEEALRYLGLDDVMELKYDSASDRLILFEIQPDKTVYDGTLVQPVTVKRI